MSRLTRAASNQIRWDSVMLLSLAFNENCPKKGRVLVVREEGGAPLHGRRGRGGMAADGGARPGFVPSPRLERGHRALLKGAAAGRVLGPRAAFEEDPCCFRPCRVFDHYILAFNSLLLFIDF